MHETPVKEFTFKRSHNIFPTRFYAQARAQTGTNGLKYESGIRNSRQARVQTGENGPEIKHGTCIL